jgi:dienelactone hydrolase
MSVVRGLEFLGRTQLMRYGRTEKTSLQIPVRGESLPAYRYSPASRLRGTILMVHGMTLRGIDDPRLENLGRSFASMGFEMVAPLFPEVRDLRITAETVSKIEDAVTWLSEDVQGSVALFSASFSGGLSIVAACRAIKNKLSAVCTVGTLGDVDSTLDFLLGQQGIDDYGTLVVLWNFLPVPEDVRTALYIAAADNGLIREPPELGKFVAGMKSTERELFERLRQDPAFRMERWKEFSSTSQFRELRQNVSPLLHVGKMPFRLVLVHGEADNVIPKEESEKLDRAFREAGTETQLCVTPLISHGDGSIGLSAAPQAWKLASAMGSFFSAI